MENFDFKKLRKDLINYYESAYFIGKFGAMIIDISKVKNASEKELITIAQSLKFNLNHYKIKKF